MPTIRKPLFVIPLDLGSMVAGNAASGYPVFNLNRHNAIGLTWKTAGASNVWARGDLGATKAIDFCAMIAANALPGTDIRLRLGTTQAEVDGTAPYDSTALDFISPAITREDGLYHSHLELPSTVNARWWRIDVTGHTGDFQAADLVLGKRIEPSRFYDYGFEYGVRDLGGMEFTRNGVIDEDPGVILRTIAMTLAWQTEAEFEASFRPMVERLGTRGIVYLCFDPDPTAYRQARTFMGVFSKAPFARGVRKPRTFSQDFDLLSFI